MPYTKLVRKVSREVRDPPPVTLGDHVKVVRRSRHLLQRDVAEVLGVTSFTISNWEKNQTAPALSLLPGIVQFLGYDPLSPESQQLVTIGECMQAFRRKHGLSIKAAAARLGVDEGSWNDWEKGGWITQSRHRIAIERLLWGGG